MEIRNIRIDIVDKSYGVGNRRLQEERMKRLSIAKKEFVKKTVEEMEIEWDVFQKKRGEKAWFNEQFHYLMEYCFQKEIRYREEEEKYITCLKGHQHKEYRDRDLLQTIMEKDRMDVSGVYLSWYSREIVERKVVIDMDDSVGKRFFKELFLGEWAKKEKDKEGESLLFANYDMVMDCSEIQYSSQDSQEAPLSEVEKTVIDFKKRELLKKCVQNGLVRSRQALEYAYKNKDLKLMKDISYWYNTKE